MSSQNTPPGPPAPLRARRWSPPRTPSNNRSRLAFRLIGIPIIAALAAFLYYGLRPHFVLPECDSSTAKQTLAQILKEPVGDAPIKTISSSKDRVVCSVVMPLSGGGNVGIDYVLYWQGSTVHIRYSIHRQAAQRS
jgi:hypothetical protein